MSLAPPTEVHSPIRWLAWESGQIVALLLLVLTMMGILLWRRRHARALQRALAAEKARQVAQEQLSAQEARYRSLIESINQGYYVTDPRSLFTYFNPALIAMGGFQPGELFGTSCFRLVAEEDRPRIIAAYKAWSADPKAIDCNCEFRALNKAGRKFWVEQTAHFKRDTAGRVIEVRNIVRNVTERKEHEREIERLNRMYLVISQLNQAIVRAKSTAGLFPEICRVLVELGQFKMAWIGWHAPATRLLAPMAVAGDVHGYVANLRISGDPGRPEGRGPTGIAFRENRTQVCNDFMASAETAPWHELAARSGFQSSIALPLRCEERTVGVLTVYAAEKDFFDAPKISLLEEAASDVSFALDVFAGDDRRRQTESQLQKLSGAVEQSPASIVITDLAGDIEYVNPWFTYLTGYTLEEVRGKNPRVLKSGLTPGDTYDEMWRTLSAGKVWRGRLHNRKKNGENFVEQAVIAPVFGPDGRATHYVAIKDDITTRVRMENALQESEERFRAMFESSLDGLLLTLTSGEILAANPAACAMLGRTEEEIRRVGRGGLVDLQDPRFAPLLEERRRTGKARGELTFIRGDGTRFEAEISSATFGTGAGQRNGMVLRDITERVRARKTLERFNAELEQQVGLRTEELAARNREIQALLRSIPDTVMLLHPDGRVLHSQPAHQGAAALAAITPAAGTQPRTGAPAALLESSLVLGRRALTEKATVAGETEITTLDGTLALELRTAPTGSGEFVVFVRDITSRKRLEAETAAMLEKERQVSEMKSRFVSLTSHEFRTPMTAIMGSVELLANHLDHMSEEMRTQLFGRITGSLHRMDEMLDDVLTLNRMDVRRTEVRPSPVNLAPLIHNIIQEIRAGDQDAHVFAVHLPETVPPFTTDPNLLHHILSNIFGNAVRYSPIDTTVTVRVWSDATWMHVSVEDQGIGIPPADHVRIFEPFERGTNVGHIKGTGLGLNIVKRLTELLGGDIKLRAAPSGGTCFTVAFPLQPPSAPSPDSAHVPDFPTIAEDPGHR